MSAQHSHEVTCYKQITLQCKHNNTVQSQLLQNMSSNTQHTTTGESYVTLEYNWETEFIGDVETTENALETSSMGYGIAAVSITKTTEFTVDILTNMKEVVESEITAFQDEIQRVTPSAMIHGETGIETQPNITVSSANVDYNANPPFNVVDNQPSIHFAVNQEGHPETLTALQLEKHVRELTGKRIDVQNTTGGFNLFVRGDRVSHETMKNTKQFIREQENVSETILRLVYTTPQNIELPYC